MRHIQYNVNYSLPNNFTTEELATALATVVSQVGISFQDATEAIHEVSQQLQDLVDRVCALENEAYDYLRPELDALIEKSNQKTDLEILEQKDTFIDNEKIISIDTKDLDEWYKEFLKGLGYDR